MRKLIEYIAQSLVDDPTAVQVREIRNDRNALVLELHVAPEDFGKVIGRQGRVAKAMRTLLRAAGVREGRHTAVEILQRTFRVPKRSEAEWPSIRKVIAHFGAHGEL